MAENVVCGFFRGFLHLAVIAMPGLLVPIKNDKILKADIQSDLSAFANKLSNKFQHRPRRVLHVLYFYAIRFNSPRTAHHLPCLYIII